MDTITIPIRLTDNAIKELIKLQSKEENKEKPYLRIGVKDGGCAGFSYLFEFDQLKDSDTLYPITDELSVIIEPEHLPLIQNIEVDFEKGLNNRGFTFNNPNAKTTCGCGTSFS